MGLRSFLSGKSSGRVRRPLMDDPCGDIGEMAIRESKSKITFIGSWNRDFLQPVPGEDGIIVEIGNAIRRGVEVVIFYKRNPKKLPYPEVIRDLGIPLKKSPHQTEYNMMIVDGKHMRFKRRGMAFPKMAYAPDIAEPTEEKLYS